MKPTIAKRHALIGLATLAAVLTVNLASATPADDSVRSVVVRYSDLDLSQPADARRLYDRIKKAARAVCEANPFSDLAQLAQYRMCVSRAVRDAVDKVAAQSDSRQSLYALFGK
jgi:UrcA family protein